jgi:hypothetical protein
MSMTAAPTVEQRIESRIDRATTQELAVSSAAGGLAFRDMAQVMEFAKILAISDVAVPKHLRGRPGACLAVAMQAIEWRMSPYAVANKSYSVNDRLAYEAQLIAAVVLERSPIVEEPDYFFEGEGEGLRCTVSIKMRSGKTLTYTSPPVGKIPVKNSPLWKGDPQQQLGYYSIRAWARRHQPNVILGVYAKEEIEESADRLPRDVTPPRPPSNLASRLDALAKPKEEPVEAAVVAEVVAEILSDADAVPDGYIDPDTGGFIDRIHTLVGDPVYAINAETGEALTSTPAANHAPAPETYLAMAEGQIEAANSLEECERLRKWLASAAQKEQRQLCGVPVDATTALKKKLDAKAASLRESADAAS